MNKYLVLVILLFSILLISCNNELMQKNIPEFQSVFKGSIYCKLKVINPPTCTEYIAGKDNTFLPDGIVLNKIHTDEVATLADDSQAEYFFNQNSFYNSSGTYSIKVQLGEFKDEPCTDYFSVYFYEQINDILFVNPFNCGGFISHYNDYLQKALKTNFLQTKFYIAKSETTFAQWKEVYDWAIQNGYEIKNSGKPSDTEYYETAMEDLILSEEEFSYLGSLPVVDICIYDVLVWLNAFSQKNNLEQVYYYKTQSESLVFKNSNSFENFLSIFADNSKNGYRLPTKEEFQFSAHGGLASYADFSISSKADDGGVTCLDKNDIFKSDFSAVYSGTNDLTALQNYAVFLENYDNESVVNAKALPVCSKFSNSIGLYDMSGNVREWIFTLDTDKSQNLDYTQIYYYTVGGSFFDSSLECMINYSVPINSISKDIYTGFRIAKTKQEPMC